MTQDAHLSSETEQQYFHSYLTLSHSFVFILTLDACSRLLERRTSILSQEMELLVERFDQFFALLLGLNHFPGALGRLLLLVGADVHLELGDLVGILAGSGHLDWTSPVKIKVT